MNDEEKLLRSAALQNAQAIRAARDRADEELVRAKQDLEKKSAELASSLAMMRATLESSTDAILVTDEKWRISEFNQKYVELWKLPPEALQCRDHRELLNIAKKCFKDPDAFERRVEQIYRAAPHDTFDILELADGRIFERYSALQVVGGQDVGRVWSFRDITARRKAEEDLRQQQEWFRVTLASIGDAVITSDIEGRVTFLNPVAEKLTGWSLREAMGQRFEDVFRIINEETREPGLTPINQVLAEGVTLALANHTALISRDGVERSIEDSAAPIRDSAGKVTGAVLVFHDVTDKRRADEEIRDREQLLRATFDQAAVGIAIAGLDGKFLDANEKFCEIVGYPLPDLKRVSFLELTHPEDVAETEALVHKLLTGEVKAYSMEKRYIRKDGEALWSHTRVGLLRDAQGRAQRFIGIVEDITDRRRAEEARSRLAAVVESSDDAIITKTLEGVISTWNRAAEKMYGYSAKEAIGQPITILIPPDRLGEEPVILERLKRGERIEHYETVRRRKDGTLFNVALTVSPVHDAKGKVIGVSKIARDITGRIRAETILREEASILETLNRTGAAVAAQLDLQAVVQIVTDAATKLTGAQFGAFFYFNKDEAGNDFLLYALSGAPPEAFAGFGHPRATALFGPTFRGEGVVRCEDVLKDPRYGKMPPHHGLPKGHMPVRSYMAAPVVGRSGGVLGGLFFGHPEPGIFTERSERLLVGLASQAAIAIDNARLYEAAQRELSERKKAEAALRAAQEQLSHHAEELEDQVADRTAKLRETIGELEAFSYSISHDMRAPLRAMQSFALILQEEYAAHLPDEARGYLGRITTAAERMDHLIQDVLTYSRVARTDLPLHPVDLHTIIGDIIDTYPSLREPTAEVTIIGKLPDVCATEAILTQCISNLLGNAVKFVAPAIKPSVKIWAEDRGNGEIVRLIFQDNGLGIDPHSHQHIFGIFQRVSNIYEGTGIGLAIVKKGIERMGGSVGLESTPGKGSAFWLELKKASDQ